MPRSLKIGVWFAVAAVVGVWSASHDDGRANGATAPRAAKVVPAAKAKGR